MNYFINSAYQLVGSLYDYKSISLVKSSDWSVTGKMQLVLHSGLTWEFSINCAKP